MTKKHRRQLVPASPAIRRWLRRSDMIGRMSRLEWAAWTHRDLRDRQLIHKGGKP